MGREHEYRDVNCGISFATLPALLTLIRLEYTCTRLKLVLARGRLAPRGSPSAHVLPLLLLIL